MLPGQSSTRVLLAVLVVTFCAYAPSLGNGFAGDDVFIVRDNPVVRELQPVFSYFGWNYWYQVDVSSDLYRPVTILSYALTRHLFGDALAQHAINVLFHVLATGLVFALLRRLAVGVRTAAAGALVFGLHAIHSEAVAGIVGRAELFAFAFGAIGVLEILRVIDGEGPRRFGHGAVAAVAMFLAYCSKESAVAWLPFVPFFCAARAWRADRTTPLGVTLRNSAIPTIACALVPSVAFLALRASALAGLDAPPEVLYQVNPAHALDAAPRIATGTVLWGYGLYKTALPFSLASDYGAHVFTLRSGFADPIVLANLALVALCVVLGLRIGRRRPLLMLAAVGFFGFSFLTTNIPIPIGTIFAERLYYAPSLAASFVAVWALERFPRARGVRIAIAAWLVASTWVIVERNPAWENDEALFFTDVEAQPRSARLHLAVAGMLAARGETDRAIAEAERAVEIEPDYAGAWVNLGAIHRGRSDFAAAERALERAASAAHQQRGDEEKRRLNLALVYLGTDRADQAIALTAESSRRWPENRWFQIEHAHALCSSGRKPDGRAEFQRLLRRADLLPAQRARIEELLRGC